MNFSPILIAYCLCFLNLLSDEDLTYFENGLFPFLNLKIFKDIFFINFETNLLLVFCYSCRFELIFDKLYNKVSFNHLTKL
jgi:hypothetical protein